MSQYLRVVSYNIHHGTDAYDNPSMDGIAEVLARLDADIIALQEVDMNRPRSGGKKQAAELARRLEMGYVFGAAKHYRGGAYGNAVLSRFPIAAFETIPLPDPGEDRCCLQVQIKVANHILGFFALHLGLNQELRLLHLQQQVLPNVLSFPGPAILAGDFNAVSNQPEIRLVTQHLTDCFDFNCGGPINTFSSPHPVARLDYIFVNSQIHVRQHYITNTDASDHFPVTADLIL
ncbi:MAG TPA: endonuclease/exonuclease/phosphatase family protein [Syntrophomonadaceae bacterium]|nr:endonuclease/exonuclease/phosphatase family protein [Syntrophomonadaceae bacterium]HQE23674.1 endonuclease/exonuclease/phosphatase family protein [Syntrophomonadaceae bacterium]